MLPATGDADGDGAMGTSLLVLERIDPEPSKLMIPPSLLGVWGGSQMNMIC